MSKNKTISHYIRIKTKSTLTFQSESQMQYPFRWKLSINNNNECDDCLKSIHSLQFISIIFKSLFLYVCECNA